MGLSGVLCMVSFEAFLLSLRGRGQGKLADQLLKKTVKRFAGVFSEADLLQKDCNEIIGVLDITKVLERKLAKQRGTSPLKDYVASLQRQGFSVVVGSEYQQYLL
jgi:hypothetical protein